MHDWEKVGWEQRRRAVSPFMQGKEMDITCQHSDFLQNRCERWMDKERGVKGSEIMKCVMTYKNLNHYNHTGTRVRESELLLPHPPRLTLQASLTPVWHFSGIWCQRSVSNEGDSESNTISRYNCTIIADDRRVRHRVLLPGWYPVWWDWAADGWCRLSGTSVVHWQTLSLSFTFTLHETGEIFAPSLFFVVCLFCLFFF